METYERLSAHIDSPYGARVKHSTERKTVHTKIVGIQDKHILCKIFVPVSIMDFEIIKRDKFFALSYHINRELFD
jgi:hypothetical protein